MGIEKEERIWETQIVTLKVLPGEGVSVNDAFFKAWITSAGAPAVEVAMSKDLEYKAVSNVESRRTWDRDYYEAKAKEKLEKGDDFKSKDDPPARRSVKEEFQMAPAGAAGPAGSSRAYLKVSRIISC